MTVVIFGNGPLPIEPGLPVMAPGSRTWQLTRAVADGLALAHSKDDIIVFGLDDTPHADGTTSQVVTIQTLNGPAAIRYIPLPYHEFIQLHHQTDSPHFPFGTTFRAALGTGSVQPCSTAADFARARNLPLWIDIFGDPLSEIQSQASIMSADYDQTYETRLVHVWKLLTNSLLYGDRFSAISSNHRYALLGQLGCAGRLNQHTVNEQLVSTVPYAVYADELLAASNRNNPEDTFTILWCGSFNTWMDVPSLSRGITDALLNNPSMRLIVAGGKIPGYNEVSYQQFLNAIRSAGVEGSVTLLDWQPLSRLAELYAKVDVGISIDRQTYEAELGSRTRLVNFLAAGVPVISTVVTELTHQLQKNGYLFPFELNNPASLTEVLLHLAKNPQKVKNLSGSCREYILNHFNAEKINKPLVEWIAHPITLSDKTFTDNSTNTLIPHQLALINNLK